MEGNIRDLNALARKYQEQVDLLQGQLDEARKNLTVVSQAIDLLRREGNEGQEKLFNIPEVVSSRYKDASMSAAIKDILFQKKPEKLPAEIIYQELVKNGFKSNSTNMKRDLYTRLFRMVQSGILVSAKKGKFKKYSLVDTKESAEELKVGGAHLISQS